MGDSDSSDKKKHFPMTEVRDSIVKVFILQGKEPELSWSFLILTINLTDRFSLCNKFVSFSAEVNLKIGQFEIQVRIWNQADL